MPKANQQYREDQEPTVTGKSSGIEYIHSQLEPRQGEADGRKEVTDNDNGKKG